MDSNHKMSDKYLNSNYRKYFDLAYDSKSEDQKMDIWLPDTPAENPYPVIMYFHGGGFRAGAKRENQSEPVIRMLQLGYAVADVDYRKSGEALFPAMLMDAKAAVRFLRANAERYDIDSNRIAAWGASCGGWIVSMLGTTVGKKEFEDREAPFAEYSDAVQAVVDWCGPCGNFLLMDEDFSKSGLGVLEHTEADTAEGSFMGARLSEIPDLCAFAAPITHVHADIPPFLIVHGQLDQVVPVQQSRRFYEKIVGIAGENRAEYHELEGVYHHSKPWNDDLDIEKITRNFLDRVLMHGHVPH